MKGNHYSRIKSLWCPTWDLICIMEISEGDLMSCSSTVGNMKTETIFWVWDILLRSSFGAPNTRKTLANWSEFSWEPPRWVRQEHLSLRRGWGSWAGAVWRWEALGGPNSSPQPVPTRRRSQTSEARLFTAVPGGWVRGSGHTLKEEMFRPLNFFPKCSQALEQMTQRLCSLYPWRGSTPTGLAQSLQQSGLTSELTLLWAGG